MRAFAALWKGKRAGVDALWLQDCRRKLVSILNARLAHGMALGLMWLGRTLRETAAARHRG